MKFTGERVILGKSGEVLEQEHLARYEFARQYVKNKKVLDLGCGSGYGTFLLAQLAKEVIGIDISDETINYARDNYQKENIKFYVGDASNLDLLQNEIFDVIVSFEVIEHISHFHRYLKEVYRLLKSGGIFIISTPNKKYSRFALEKPLNPFHVIEFWLDDFQGLLKKYFSNVKLYGQSSQIMLKNFVKKLLPSILRRIIFPQTIKNTWNLRQALKFTTEDIDSCKFFIAICEK